MQLQLFNSITTALQQYNATRLQHYNITALQRYSMTNNMQLQQQLPHYNLQHYSITTSQQQLQQHQLQLQLLLQLHQATIITITATATTPHHTTLHPAVVVEVTAATTPTHTTPTTFRSITHPCIPATHLSYSFLSLRLPPQPCAVLLVAMRVRSDNTGLQCGLDKTFPRQRERERVSVWRAQWLNKADDLSG